MATSHSAFEAHPDVVLTEMNDGTGVLLHMRTKFYYSLNETGVFLWKAIERKPGSTLESLVLMLSSEYDLGAEVDRVRRDVEQLVTELADEELVVGKA